MYFCKAKFCKEMKADSYNAAKRIMNNYLEQNKRRKTPERYAVLEAIYGLDFYFSIQDLNNRLCEMNFPVSRATLYNTIRLLMELHLVVSLRLPSGVRYKASYADSGCVQVCTVCGKAQEVKIPEVTDLLANVHLKRFRKDSFVTYIYGICSTCQAKLTRLKRKRI